MAGHGHSHGGMRPEEMMQMQQMMAEQMKPKELLSFRAGQLNLSHNGTTVVADKRRGKLSLVQTPGEDGVLRIQWVQRPTGQLQETDDMMVMPRTAFFEKVPECKTGRVILLRFRGSSRKRFFWMQEPKDDKDAELIKKLNDLMDNPPAMEGMGMEGMPAGAAGLGGVPGGMGLEGMDVDQAALMEMLSQQPAARAAAARAIAGAVSGAGGARPAASGASGAGGAGAAGARPAGSAAPSSSSSSSSGAKSGASASATDSKSKGASGSSSGGAKMSDAQIAALMNAAAREQIEAQHGRHSLTEILDAERVLGAGLSDEEIQPLLQYLPEGQRTVGEFRAALRSPQFKQTLGRMSSVLNSSNFGQLLASFGLSPTGNMGVNGFTEALEADTKRKAEKAAAGGSSSGSAAAAKPATPSASSAAAPAAGGSGSGSSSASGSSAPPKADDKKTGK